MSTTLLTKSVRTPAIRITSGLENSLFVSVEGGYSSILPGLVAMGLSMTPSTEAITGSLPQHRQGVASALNDITREFGTALA